MMGHRTGPEQGAARAVPWMGLLLWMFACAALFVSLIMRADDLDHERRVATRSVAKEELLDRAHPLTGLTQHAGGFNLFIIRRPPSH